MCCAYGTCINNIRTIYVPLAGRRRHTIAIAIAIAFAIAFCQCECDAQAQRRRLWASTGLAYVGAVALYVRNSISSPKETHLYIHIYINRECEKKMNKQTRQNKTKNSSCRRPTWYMRCMLIKMSKIVLHLSPSGKSDALSAFWVLLDSSNELDYSNFELGCWAHARIFRFNWQKRSHHHHHQAAAAAPPGHRQRWR